MKFIPVGTCFVKLTPGRQLLCVFWSVGRTGGALGGCVCACVEVVEQLDLDW